MALVRIDWNPPPKVLRTFAWSLVATAALVWGLVAWFGARPQVGHPVAGVLALCGLLVLVGPRVVRRPIYVVFTGPAWVIGNVMSRVIVAVVFYLLVTPMGLIARLFGFDPLAVGARKAVTFVPLDAAATPPDDYERPF